MAQASGSASASLQNLMFSNNKNTPNSSGTSTIPPQNLRQNSDLRNYFTTQKPNQHTPSSTQHPPPNTQTGESFTHHQTPSSQDDRTIGAPDIENSPQFPSFIIEDELPGIQTSHLTSKTKQLPAVIPNRRAESSTLGEFFRTDGLRFILRLLYGLLRLVLHGTEQHSTAIQHITIHQHFVCVLYSPCNCCPTALLFRIPHRPNLKQRMTARRPEPFYVSDT